MQSLDIQNRSATTTAAPQVRRAADPVAKLIDISKCIGCKACQVACMQWNDLRDDIGTNVGVYDNPMDLTDQSWTVMRFSEISQDRRVDGVADPQGRLHALRGSGLPEGLSRAGRHRQVRQRDRRLHLGELHRLRLLHRRLPVQHSADQRQGQQGLQVLVVLGSRECRPGARVREDLPHRAPSSSAPRRTCSSAAPSGSTT